MATCPVNPQLLQGMEIKQLMDVALAMGVDQKDLDDAAYTGDANAAVIQLISETEVHGMSPKQLKSVALAMGFDQKDPDDADDKDDANAAVIQLISGRTSEKALRLVQLQSSEPMWTSVEADMPTDACAADTINPTLLVRKKQVVWQSVQKQCVASPHSFQHTTVYLHPDFENSQPDDAAFDHPQATGVREEPVLHSNTTGHHSETRSQKRRSRRLGKAMGRMTPEQSVNVDRMAQPMCAQSEESLDGGCEDQVDAFQEVHGRVWELSQDARGCWVVQRALENPRRIAEQVTAELHGNVREAVGSPHANYVIQKIIENMPAPQHAFVARELLGQAVYTACRRFGCRILIRLVQHSTDTSSSTLDLIDELLLERDTVIKLCRHQFGRHVIQAIVEHGSQHQRDRIRRALLSPNQHYEAAEHLLSSALHRQASFVIESLIRSCSEDRSALCDALLNDSLTVQKMANNQFGTYVLKSLLESSTNCSQVANARVTILNMYGHLGSNKHAQEWLRFVQTLNVKQDGDGQQFAVRSGNLVQVSAQEGAQQPKREPMSEEPIAKAECRIDPMLDNRLDTYQEMRMGLSDHELSEEQLHANRNHSRSAQAASMGKAKCIMEGCSRGSWNEKPGEACCRLCTRTRGKDHGPQCNERNKAANGPRLTDLSGKYA